MAIEVVLSAQGLAAVVSNVTLLTAAGELIDASCHSFAIIPFLAERVLISRSKRSSTYMNCQCWQYENVLMEASDIAF